MRRDVAIRLEGISKRYRIGERGSAYTTLREALQGWVRSRLRRDDRRAEREIWALRDVDLEVGAGEAVGIVGRNGAGKTTLLRIIARITPPHSGVARVRGRVGSLLDVGTGFHPELTGRENIQFSGSILGMARADIRRRLDEIVDFAGVERFLDTPLKRYSTGMRLRLAFAVAAHLEAEILVVDEVLAAGDADFQRRCLGRMSDLEAEGRTVLFVSHDLGAISQLCQRGIWIDGGRVQEDGPAADVVARYMREVVATPGMPVVDLGGRVAGPVELTSLRIVDEADEWPPRRDRTLEIHIAIRALDAIPALDIALWILDEQGRRLVDDAWSDTRSQPVRMQAGESYEVRAVVPPLMRAGDYVLGAWLGPEGGYEAILDEELARFTILPRPGDREEWLRRPRVTQPPVRWELSRLG
jgi:ABC-type polysaccharide/polyol phosphate transport system ATPase subunit